MNQIVYMYILKRKNTLDLHDIKKKHLFLFNNAYL